MTFTEAQQQLDGLLAQWRAGTLTREAFAGAVNALRVTDEAGRWWQPDPGGNGWLCWDGAAWQPAIPPVAAPAPPPAAAVSPPPVAAPAESPGKLGVWAADVRAQVRAQADDPQTFLRLARSLPLRSRPESWWNALSIFGGAASGYFWFVYGSVSGLPTPAFLSSGPLAKYARFLAPLVLLVLPILLLRGRQRVTALFSGIGRRFGRLSLAGKVVVIAVLVGLYFVFPRLLAKLAYIPGASGLSVLRLNFGEGIDIVTPLMMVGLPIAFIYLRRPLDRFVARFAFLRKMPPPLRLGIGLAMPFLTAYLLFWFGFTEYPLLRANVLVGTVLSYLLVRTPRLLAAAGRPSGPAPAVTSLLLLLGCGMLLLLLADPALADCFLTDPFNFNDGLRTDGVAPILAGVATTTVSLLINGVEFARTVIQDTGPVKEGDEAKHTRFQVKVELQDAKGMRSSKLSARETEPLFLLAHCENEQGLFPAGDPTIQVTVTRGQEWVVMTEEQVPNCRCWRLLMPDPAPKTPAPSSVEIVISAGQGGGLIRVPVHLSLDLPTIMRAEMVNGHASAVKGKTYPVYDAWVEAEKKGWNFGELVIFWCKPEDTDTPINTGYAPFEWTITVKPDYLTFDPPAPASDDGNLTWRTRAALKPGLKLPEDWLATDGVIDVRVSCRTTVAP